MSRLTKGTFSCTLSRFEYATCPAIFEDAIEIAAFVHGLDKTLSDEIVSGTYQHVCHPMLVRQSKWRAARYRLDAQVIDSDTFELQFAPEIVRELVERVPTITAAPGCSAELDRILAIADRPNRSKRQLDVLKAGASPMELNQGLTTPSRVSLRTIPQPKPAQAVARVGGNI